MKKMNAGLNSEDLSYRLPTGKKYLIGISVMNCLSVNFITRRCWRSRILPTVQVTKSTILANITSRAQNLVKVEEDVHRRRELSTIETQAHRASSMIADLMVFAQPPL